MKLSLYSFAVVIIISGCLKPIEETTPIYTGDTRPTLYFPNVPSSYPGADTARLKISIYGNYVDGKLVDPVQSFEMGPNFHAKAHLDTNKTYYFDIYSTNSYWHNWSNNPHLLVKHHFAKHTDTLPMNLVHNYNYRIKTVGKNGWTCIGAIDSANRDITAKVSRNALYRVVKINSDFTGSYQYKDENGTIQIIPTFLRTDSDGVSLFEDKEFTQYVNKIKPRYINGYVLYHNRMMLEPEYDDSLGVIFMPHLDDW
jgi:hypothetical protein